MTTFAEYGAKRWENVSPEKRSRLMKKAVKTRWNKATKKQRKELGRFLAEARNKAKQSRVGLVDNSLVQSTQ